MADIVFNIARGRIREKAMNGGSNFGVMLLKAAEADAALADHNDLAALLAAVGNTEADFTNYARKTGLAATQAVDDANEQASADIADQTWSSAGGAANNTLVKLVVYFQESASDAGRIPMTAHDFAATTDGSDLTAQIASGGFYQSN